MAIDTLNTALAYSCSLPATLGVVYYKRMDKSFHPFIWAMWLSVITETAIRFVFDYSKQPVVYISTYHLYYICNYVFFVLFFYRQKTISLPQCKKLLLAGALIFILNSLLKSPATNLLGEKTIVFHLILFYLAVKLINEQIFSLSSSLKKNALFFISCGLLLVAFPILQNTIRIVVRYFYQLPTPKITVLQRIFEIANAFSYILFFYAIIFIPKKNIHNLPNEQRR